MRLYSSSAAFAAFSLALTSCSSMSERWRDWVNNQDQAARKAVDTDSDSDYSRFARPMP